MTGISLHMPLTSQLHGSVPQREQLVFQCKNLTRVVLGTIWGIRYTCKLQNLSDWSPDVFVTWRVVEVLVVVDADEGAVAAAAHAVHAGHLMTSLKSR
jgi:hypothetical protein